MKNFRLKYLLFLFFLWLAAGQTASAESDILTVQGNKIMLNGQRILLRGVSMGDPHDRLVTYKRSAQDDYAAIKRDWRANIVRLSVHPGVFLNDWARGKKILEDEVAAARVQGLLVIIDWHVIGWPDGWFKIANDADLKKYYSYSSNFATAKNFWLYAAEKFKDDRGIIFELWNEPVSPDGQATWGQLKPYMSELVSVIRNAGSQNIILSPAVDWAYDLREIKTNALSGTNIAYSWHVYNNGSSLSRESALDGLNQFYPVFITEWGSNSAKDFGYSQQDGQNVYNYLEAVKNLIISQDLSHTAWCWHESWKPSMFNAGWKEANSYGVLVKDFLRQPEKVSARLAADEQKKQEAAEAAQKPASQQATYVGTREQEFKLRLENYLNNGADANSAKFSRQERRAILANFIAAFGHEPSDESEWQDLIRINNGYWPSKYSQAAENKAVENFKKIFKRSPDLRVNSDKHAVKILAYGIRQRQGLRSLKKEAAAISRFKKKFKYMPKSEGDWNFIRAIAYGGVK